MFKTTTLTAALMMTALSGAALAETATVPTAGGAVTVPTTPGATAVVPTPQSLHATPVVTTQMGVLPPIEQMDNNEKVAEALLAQGFTDVKIDRQGTLMTVTAMRDGKPMELVYNSTTGQLVKLNGEPVLTEDQATIKSTPADKAGTDAKPDDTAKPDSDKDAGKDAGKTDGDEKDGDEKDDTDATKG